MEPNERQEVLSDLSTVATSDLVQAWRSLSLVDAEFAVLMTAAFYEIATAYSGIAADLAAGWYVESAPLVPWEPIIAPAPSVEALSKSAGWALSAEGDAALNRMSGTLQRSVFDGARDTITLNVQAEGSRWVRHAQPDACAFCRMMATRRTSKRYWYRTATSALDVVGRSGRARGKRAVGSRGFHDFCRCLAVEVREGQEYEPPEYVQAWDDELKKAQANAGRGDMRSILKAWREQGAR